MQGEIKKIFLTKHKLILRPFLGTIIGVQTKKPFVALTFDDGPHPVYTPMVLDILSKYRARATFFIVGEMAAQYPELVQRLKRSGHAIGNHSWDHSSFPEIAANERKIQIKRWEEIVGEQPMKLFRPPYGHQTIETRLQLWRYGYRVVMWSKTIEDWLPLSAETAADRICQKGQPGVILLMHDAHHKSRLDKPQTDRTDVLEGLDNALNNLKNSYQFVTVPELLKQGRSIQVLWTYGAGSM